MGCCSVKDQSLFYEQLFQLFGVLLADAEEELKKQEWLEQARKELQDWERNRLEQLEKTKENNR